MVAYYAMTKFHLIFSLTHKISENQEKEGIIFLYSGLKGVNEYRDKILELGIFKEVYIVNEIELRSGWKGINDENDIDSINYDIQILTDAVEEWLPVNLRDMEKIYLVNDHWALGIYCIKNKIPYIYYEDGVGMLSKPEYSYELVYKQNKSHAYISGYIGAFGKNEYVLYKLADMNNQYPDFKDEKAVHYSLKDKLFNLDNSERNKILYIFAAPKVHISSSRCTLLFTEHFINMKRLLIEEQMELYALLCDYFQKGDELIIKPHPNDIHVNYQKIFPEAKILSKEFPSELIPYCFDNKIELGLAACSTAVLGLKDFFNNIIRFDINIEKTYVKFHKYYALSYIIKKLNLKVTDMIGIEEIHYKLFKELTLKNDVMSVDEEKTKLTCIVADKIQDDMEISREMLEMADCTIFLDLDSNFDFSYNFFNTYGVKNIAVIEIKKKVKELNYLTNINNEYIYVLINNSKVREKIGGVSLMKNLSYSGADIEIDNISGDDKIKIKFLEACLKASNEKLQYYIEKEKRLNTQSDKN